MEGVNGYWESLCGVPVAMAAACYAVRVKSCQDRTVEFSHHFFVAEASKTLLVKTRMAFSATTSKLHVLGCVLCVCVRVGVRLCCSLPSKGRLLSRIRSGWVIFHKNPHLPSETIGILCFSLQTAISSPSLILLFRVFCGFTFFCKCTVLCPLSSLSLYFLPW